jgi:hypothetical protein
MSLLVQKNTSNELLNFWPRQASFLERSLQTQCRAKKACFMCQGWLDLNDLTCFALATWQCVCENSTLLHFDDCYFFCFCFIYLAK